MTSGPVNVDGLRAVIGDSLPGAQGRTRADQVAIDRTVARGCAAGIYVREKCNLHTETSATRLGELTAERGG